MDQPDQADQNKLERVTPGELGADAEALRAVATARNARDDGRMHRALACPANTQPLVAILPRVHFATIGCTST
jgi:hypothetical protein